MVETKKLNINTTQTADNLAKYARVNQVFLAQQKWIILYYAVIPLPRYHSSTYGIQKYQIYIQ